MWHNTVCEVKCWREIFNFLQIWTMPKIPGLRSSTKEGYVLNQDKQESVEKSTS